MQVAQTWRNLRNRFAGGGTPTVAVYLSRSALASAVLAAEQDSDATPLPLNMQAAPLAQWSELPSTLSQQLANLNVTERCQLNLVLAPELYHLLLVERPEVADEEVTQAVRWTLGEQVDYPIEQATIDTFSLPASAGRDKAMVFVVVIRTDLLRQILDLFGEVRMVPTTIDVAELALRNLAWQCYPGADQSVGVLRLTSNSGLINISRGDELYLSRRISGMPGLFSEAVWAEFKERLLLQVQRSIDYYESAMGQPHCNMLMVTCTDGWTERVCAYLGEMLPMPIRDAREMLQHELALRMFNPEPQAVDWADMSDAQANAIAAALPALGGVLRGAIDRQHERRSAA